MTKFNQSTPNKQKEVDLLRQPLHFVGDPVLSMVVDYSINHCTKLYIGHDIGHPLPLLAIALQGSTEKITVSTPVGPGASAIFSVSTLPVVVTNVSAVCIIN